MCIIRLMNIRDRKRLRDAFFAKLGANAETFMDVLRTSRDVCINIKDAEGRIMALNRRNCEVCNIRREIDAIGKRSDDLFAPVYASTYMALDRAALAAKKPIRGRVTCWPADGSPDFMVSDLYPLKDARGRTIGTLHAYRLSREAGPDARRYGKMRKIVTFVAENCGRDLPLSRLAEIAGLSVTAFRREFGLVFGTTPADYITTARLNEARKLLETTELSISEIATRCGFYDQSHLTHAFRQKRGVTPGEYRRRASS